MRITQVQQQQPTTNTQQPTATTTTIYKNNNKRGKNNTREPASLDRVGGICGTSDVGVAAAAAAGSLTDADAGPHQTWQ